MMAFYMVQTGAVLAILCTRIYYDNDPKASENPAVDTRRVLRATSLFAHENDEKYTNVYGTAFVDLAKVRGTHRKETELGRSTDKDTRAHGPFDKETATDGSDDQDTKGNGTTDEEESDNSGARTTTLRSPKRSCTCQCRPSDRIPEGRIQERSCTGWKKLRLGFIALLDGVNGVLSGHSWNGSLRGLMGMHSKISSGASERRLQVISLNTLNSGILVFKIRTDVNHTNCCTTALRNNRNNATRKGSGATDCCESGKSDNGEGGDDNGRGISLVSLAIAAVIAGDRLMRMLSRKTAHSLCCLRKNLQTDNQKDRIAKDSECLIKSSSVENFIYKQFIRPIATFSKIWVAPATRFLPSSLGQGSDPLDYEGVRIGSLAALPSSCKFSRLRLASAGFHFDPSKNINAVVCHKCGASISIGASPSECSPLAAHHRQSPNCPFVKDLMDKITEDPASLTPMSFSEVQSGSNQPTGTGSSSSSSASSSLDTSSSPSFSSSSPGTSLSTSSLSSARTSLPSIAAAGREVADSRADLMTDDDSSPAADSHKPTQREQHTFASTGGYAIALPSTGQNVLMSASFTPSTRPSIPVPTTRPSSSPLAAAVLGPNPGSQADKPALNLSDAVYPQFSTTQSREATFTDWPLERYFPANYMVGLGFYFAGYADCVRCFFCGVGLKTWYEDDDPQVEHIRWRPHCQFVLATKGRQFVADTLQRIQAAERNPNSQQGRQQTRSLPSSTSATSLLSQNQNGPPTQPVAVDSTMMDQLTSMGFSTEAIARAVAQLRESGRQLTLDNMVQILLG